MRTPALPYRASLLALLLVGLGLAGADEVTAPPASPGVAVSYQLPTDGPLPRTYRVTLALTAADDAAWIVSTFLCGAERTVTAANQGKFTDYCNGLDDNDMPLPPGKYGVKGIFLPAEKWSIDGRYHSLIPKLAVGAGDSWFPSQAQDSKFPWIFGHVFGNIDDVSVGLNGAAAFYGSYIENAYNPYLVDLNKPVSYDQVLAKYWSGGTAGGTSIACDGEMTWGYCEIGADRPFLYRADRQPFGNDRTSIIGGVTLLDGPTTSMCAWKDPASGKRFLYVTQPKSNRIDVFDGVTGARLAQTAVNGPQSVMLDRTAPGSRLLALHRDPAGKWQVSGVALQAGVPAGEWTVRCEVAGIDAPVDCESDSRGNLYVLDTDASQVYQLGPAGQLLRKLATGAKQTPGRYDDHVFMSPVRLATWTDAAGKDRVLVVERSGPGRISEWDSEGKLLRSWFLIQNANFGYFNDSEHPEHIYVAANFPLSGSGLIRYKADYATGNWTVDAVWPDICRWGYDFPGGTMYGQIFNRNGNKYLTFPYTAGLQAQSTMIYKQEGANWRPCAGAVREDTGTKDKNQRPVINEFWWTDANGDGKLQPGEYKPNPIQFPSHSYWGDTFSEEMSLLVMDADRRGWQELPVTGFDKLGNPLYKPDGWRPICRDTVYEARAAGKADALHGGNEVANELSDWARIAGSRDRGYWVADPSGPANPGGADNAGSRYSQVKLSYYAPDGKGNYQMKWRVGRKAWRVAQPGQVYATQHLSAPIGGILGTWDSNGLYHCYSDEGMYVDTVMADAFAGNLEKHGVYTFAGEAWYGKQFPDPVSDQTLLFIGRPTCSVYTVPGWGPKRNPVRKVTAITPQVTLTAAQTAPASEYALIVRGGPGQAKVARFIPSPGGGPALDGSLRGWEAATPVTFAADSARAAEVRCLYDPRTLYLRWHLRLPEPFTPQEMGNPNRLFTHERHADTMSFYLQGDPNAAPSTTEGRAGDVRLVFAVVKDGGQVRPVCLGMYVKAPPGVPPAPVTYVSPVSKVTYAHVAPLDSARLGYALDADQKGLVLAAAIPVSELPGLPLPNGSLRTQVDFSVTLGGVTPFWWANTGLLGSMTNTTDEPSEARLYPGAWAQAQFVGMDTYVVHDWFVCGPWGGEQLKERPFDPHPQPLGHAFTRRFFAAAKYPPDGGVVDPKAVYTGPLTLDVEGKPHEVRWQQASTPADRVQPFPGMSLGYAATWLYVPQACELEASFLAMRDQQGSTQVWVDDQAVQGQMSSAWGVPAPQPVTPQKIALRQGWNKVFFRSYAGWGNVTFGLHLKGPEATLWSLRSSALPPE